MQETERMASNEVEEDDGPPPGYQSIPLPPSAPATAPQPQSQPQSQPQQQPLPQPLPPLQPQPHPQPQLPPLPTAAPPSEIAQMVCGSCRRLLKYSRGARNVQCSCCQTVNFVLEAHEVGLVKCGSCTVLLMYQFGAASVRCSSCSFVTEIGAHNGRPPWSVQQGQPPLPPN